LLGVRAGEMNALTIDAAWKGRGQSLLSLTGQAASHEALASIAGSGDLHQLHLTQAALARAGKSVLRLLGPAVITWTPRFAIRGLRLAGGESEVALDLDPDQVSATIAEIPSAWVRDWVRLPGPDVTVRSGRLTGHWKGERLVFAGEVDAEGNPGPAFFRAGPQPAAPGLGGMELQLKLASDGASVAIDQLQVAAGTGVLAEAHGTLPLWWSSAARPHWQADPNGPLQLHAASSSDPSFWNALARQFGIDLQAPEAHIDVSGTLARPIGRLDASVDRLAAIPGRTALNLPSFDRVRVRAGADRSEIVLQQLEGTIAGQPIRAAGRLATADLPWREKKPLAALVGRVQATVDVSDSDLAPLAHFAPRYLSPAGRWRMHVQLDRGQLTGAVHLSGAALRPLPPIGIIQSISGDVALHGRRVEIPGLTAEIGGQTVRLTGSAELPAKGAPQFDIALAGSDVPILRSSSLLIRANVELKAKTNGSDTDLTGSLAVTDGILLGSLGDLLPSGQSGAERPPPYFSIDVPPFARWRLNVGVTADHSLRARTPVFDGTGSAHLSISGTLMDPRAVGLLQVDSGQISLPFASFDVQVATIRMTADDPIHPKVAVSATGQRYDYTIRMNIAGNADQPVMTFTSNPALPSDQILALVMAGQVPSTGAVATTGLASQVAGLGAYFGQNLFQGLSGSTVSRIEVITGQQISVSGRPTYLVQYRLAPRWWLEGEYDEFDAYDIGVRWRVFSQGGKKRGGD
jgi:translocation and assembly module TamB